MSTGIPIICSTKNFSETWLLQLKRKKWRPDKDLLIKHCMGGLNKSPRIGADFQSLSE